MSKFIMVDMEFIKFVMEQQNLTTKALAEMLKVPDSTIKKFLNGADQTHIKLLFVYRIAKALDISVIQLLRGTFVDVPK